MFANALKSIGSTNINSNYTISSTLISTAGPWKIYPAKKKSTGKDYSVFVFDKKSLDAHSSGLSRSGASQFKAVVAEVVERLKKEASSLAKLRHPGVLELVEPVEEIKGGLQFVTEPVTASLASLLQEKDEQEKSGGIGGRSSRYVTEDPDGTRRRREIEIDELEIQKGLLQVGKALEFLHENAGLVHGNLTPDAILVNAKSDWKISGLSFCSPQADSNKPTSIQPISLSEVLHLDPRLPKSVQLNLDYTSPDFVLDTNLTSSADMFSLGLLCIALYNSPHRSPLECNGSLSSYKRHFQSSQGVPSANNNYLSSRELPRDLKSHVLPRLITRRPAQRMTAREFQQSEYFDNILVSTIRFLDAFPAKTPNEKSQFLRGLVKVLPSFPKSVMEKKVLPALLEELKDRELLSLILHNVFKIIELLPSGRRAFGDRVRPKLKEIFVDNAKQTQERDPARDAGLMIILEQLPVIVENCSGKEFKDDILRIVYAALESPTPTLVDAALRSLPTILPVLDFSTIKNELFPVVAVIFSRTNSLAIKVRTLQAFVILCGGSENGSSDDDDGLNGFGGQERKKTTTSSALDKFTMQEKIVPLVKGIKTKEPAVMIAALNVLRIVGKIADADFVAMEILPILWSMSLGPLLNLKQFQGFMELIKTLSKRVEDEQIKKLQELSGSNGTNTGAVADDFMSFGAIGGANTSLDGSGAAEGDFERLVKGGAGVASSSSNSNLNMMDTGPGWGDATAKPAIPSPRGGVGRSSGKSTPTPAFSWSSPSPTSPVGNNTGGQFGAAGKQPQGPGFRTVTPDLGRIEALTPSATQFSTPLQPVTSPLGAGAGGSGWPSSSNNISSPSTLTNSFGGMSLGQQMGQQQQQRPAASTSSSFSLPPPPGAGSGLGSMGSSGFSLAPPPGSGAAIPKPLQPSTSTFGVGTLGGMQTSGSTSFGMGMGSMMSNNNSMGSMMANRGAAAGGMGSLSMGVMQPLQAQAAPRPQQQQLQQQTKSGLDRYESLL